MGKTLSDSNSYVIHFPSNDLPSSVVNSYWSVILVGVPNFRVVPNKLKRYNYPAANARDVVRLEEVLRGSVRSRL